MKFSLVVSTIGRTAELVALFESFDRLDYRDFEVIVVDQNSDDRIVPIIEDARWSFPLTRISTPTQRGLSRARNVGWRAAKGEIVTFPDDDCWYPEWMLSKALSLLEETGADMLAGRAADQTGRSINGSFEPVAQQIGTGNVWSTQIEWVVFFKRSALERLGGYNEDIGIGAYTPWQACEGQDITLRALAIGLRCSYSPSLYAHHKEAISTNPDETLRRKQRGYARGMGRVLRIHGFGLLGLLRWTVRPGIASMYHLMRGRPHRSRYSATVFLGRLEGWLGVQWKLLK
jgi:GT2 family glycosyltransferase